MSLNFFDVLGLFLMLFHGMLWIVSAARHGIESGSFSFVGSNVDHQMVEQMWLDCGLDLVALKEEVQRSASYLSKDILLDPAKINSRAELLAKVNRSFLNCLVRHNLPLHNSEEDTLTIWFAGYLESLNGHLPDPRRYLTYQNSDDDSDRSPDDDSAQSLEPGGKPHKHSSAPPPPMKLSSSPLKNKPTTDKSRDARSKSQENVKDEIIIAVAMTAAVTAIFVALFLFCYLSCQKKSRYSSYMKKDDKPLLSLSLSDFSGTSQKSFGTPTHILAPPKPLKTDPTLNMHLSSSNGSNGTPSFDELKENSSFSTEPNNVTPDTTESKSPPSPPSEEPAPPPPPPKVGPRPPPPPKGAAPPQPPQSKINIIRPSKAPPPAPKQPGEYFIEDEDSNAPKTKLKPFFWDKVQANPAKSMVWDHLKAGSFQFNEEMIESLFGYTDKNKDGKKVLSGKDAGAQYVRILDPKKSQNLAISLKAMNVKTEEVCDALMEGSELPAGLLDTLLKMTPTTEEELKIRLHAEPSQLGPAEQFIRTIVEIPFAFQRMETLLFMTSLPEETSSITESFSTLDVACNELKNSRLFLKLLEAVLKTGNRMNNGTYRGDAQAFKLDTLLKLSDVRGTDGKTTLLHFVVLEIIRTEGARVAHTKARADCRSSIPSLNSEDILERPSIESEDDYHNLGFKVMSNLSRELENVKKAAGLDADTLTNTVDSLSERLSKTKEFLKMKMEGINEDSQFLQSVRGFVEHAEADIAYLLEEEKRIKLLVKHTVDYFHGNSEKDEGLRLFLIVRDFLGMIDKVCKEVKVLPKPVVKTQRSRETTQSMSPARDPRQLLFPAIKDRRIGSSSSSSSSSDDEDS